MVAWSQRWAPALFEVVPPRWVIMRQLGTTDIKDPQLVSRRSFRTTSGLFSKSMFAFKVVLSISLYFSGAGAYRASSLNVLWMLMWACFALIYLRGVPSNRQ